MPDFTKRGGRRGDGFIVDVSELEKVRLDELSTGMRKALRPVLKSALKELKQELRGGIKVFRRRKGVRKQLSAARPRVRVSRDAVEGRLTHVPPILKIFEETRQIPATTIRPRPGRALRFRVRRKGVFVRGPVSIPARTLAARPVIAPALRTIRPPLLADLRRIFLKEARDHLP